MAAVVDVNSCKKHFVDEVQDQSIQKKQQVMSEKKGKKRAFCSPGSISAYLELRKKQKGNCEAFTESNQSLNNFVSGKARNNDVALFENENDHVLIQNENDDGVGNESEGDQEFEDEILFQYGREETETKKASKSKSKRHRGPTMLPKVHARTRDEREVIVLNSFGQPVGPTLKIVEEFKLFLGTVARDSELAPLNYIDFPSLPTHDQIWNYVLEKYMVPEAGRAWVLKAINGSWKSHKCFTKKNYFYAYPTDALRWFHKPDTISVPQFQELLQYWHSKEAKEISKINKDNRLMLDDMHTMGRKSYAILRHQLSLQFVYYVSQQQQDPDKQEPSQATVYKELRKRTDGRTYLTNHEKIEENIAKMDALESSQHEDGSNSKDPYSEVIPDPKRKSRVRLQGQGVKKSDLKKKDNKSDFIFPTGFLESMQAQLVQKIAPTLTNAFLTQLWDSNPGVNLVIPEFAITSAPKDACSAPHLLTDQKGQSSKCGATIDQEIKIYFLVLLSSFYCVSLN